MPSDGFDRETDRSGEFEYYILLALIFGWLGIIFLKMLVKFA